MNGLRGKTFIIAGGATGIGAATAERLSHEGAFVTIGDINVAGAKAIVNTSSGASLGTSPLHVAYGASKAAVNHLTRHIATNWGKEGIRCNGVMPGWVMGETQFRQDNQALQEAFLKSARTTRLGVPSDLAAVTAFLLSDDSEWINGQMRSIDGGSHLRQ